MSASFIRLMALTGVVSLAATAIADVTPVAAHYIITIERASIRCGDDSLFYKMSEVGAGTILLCDGEGKVWSRVSYPVGLGVFVRAEDVEVQGTSIKTSQPTKLKAANQATGWSGSWRAVLDSPLPVGTPLKMIEGIKDGETGPILGYRVVAPEQARGFVDRSLVRKASEAELAAFKNKPAAISATVVAQSTPAAAPSTPASTATPGSANPEVATATVVETPVNDQDLTQPVVPPSVVPPPAPAPSTVGEVKPLPPAILPPPEAGAIGTSVVVQPAARPVESEVAGAAEAAEGVTPGETGTGGEPPATMARPAEVVYDLEPIFARVWKEPVLSSEVDELLAQYQRAISSLGEESSRLKQQLTRRRDALVMRVQLRDTLRAQASEQARVDANRGNVAQQVSLAEAARVYTIAGQLQASTVYDGQKLPLMFRVISVGGGVPRTLGYLKDSKELALLGKVGALVGVIGEAQLDRSLMLNVITPVRVDVLKPKNEVSTPIAPAGSGQGDTPGS